VIKIPAIKNWRKIDRYNWSNKTKNLHARIEPRSGTGYDMWEAYFTNDEGKQLSSSRYFEKYTEAENWLIKAMKRVSERGRR
jgi:hypothetical protein